MRVHRWSPSQANQQGARYWPLPLRSTDVLKRICDAPQLPPTETPRTAAPQKALAKAHLVRFPPWSELGRCLVAIYGFPQKKLKTRAAKGQSRSQGIAEVELSLTCAALCGLCTCIQQPLS